MTEQQISILKMTTNAKITQLYASIGELEREDYKTAGEVKASMYGSIDLLDKQLKELDNE